MIKKQFTFLKDTVSPNIKTPIVFNNETMSIGEVLNKLNELSNENEQLKQENNKLQGEYDYLLWLYNGLGCEYDWLKEENEQLKKRIKEAIIHMIKQLKHLTKNSIKCLDSRNFLLP